MNLYEGVFLMENVTYSLESKNISIDVFTLVKFRSTSLSIL